MPNNIKLLKWSELFSKSLPTDKSVAILTEGDVSAQDRTDVIDALNLDQTSIKPNIKTVTNNYTASFNDTYILACDSGGPITITLPKASAEAGKIGGVIYIKSSCGDDVTIEATSGDSIYVADTITLLTGDAVKLVCTDSDSWTIFDQYIAPVA
jgi:hypothetical protein